MVTNDELSQIMDTNDEWIQSRVGIAERRFAGEDDSVVSMGARASAKALAEAGLQPTDIDTVIVATCSLDSPVPHAATQIAGALGIHAPGIVRHQRGLRRLLLRHRRRRPGGAGRRVEERAGRRLGEAHRLDQPDDRATAIIFADGAGAAVVSAADEPGIGPVVWGSDETEHRGDPDRGPQRPFHPGGPDGLPLGDHRDRPVAIRAAEAAGVALADVDVLVTHQANLRIIDAIAKKVIAAGARPELKVGRDIVTTGNTSSASIPIALDRMRAAGEVASGDVVLSVAFGAGLTYASQVFICP